MALGKQLPVVVAKRLASPESISNQQSAGPITILGTEGVTVQFAKCCRPIPGDTIVGIFKKDSGLIIHTFDCNYVTSSQKNSDNFMDVTWGKDISKTFEASIKVTTANKQGVLAHVAAEIAKADSNIDDIAMESEGDYMHMRFIIQVNNRHHLAQVMRSLRRLKEVVRINRTKN